MARAASRPQTPRVGVRSYQRSSETSYRQVFERLGSRRFYRVDSFLGGKRGSVRFVTPSLDAFYSGRRGDRKQAPEREVCDFTTSVTAIGGKVDTRNVSIGLLSASSGRLA